MSAGQLEIAYQHINAGHFAQAQTILARLLHAHPDMPEANNAMAVTHAGLGQYAQAEYYGRRAVNIPDPTPAALGNLGNILMMVEKNEEAVGLFSRAVSKDAKFRPGLRGKAKALLALERYDQCLTATREGLAALPNDTDLLIIYLDLLAAMGRAEDGWPAVEEGLRVTAQNGKDLAWGVCFQQHYVVGRPPAEMFDLHARAARELLKAGPPAPILPANKDPERKLRIGFVSPDLRYHSVAFFVQPLLAGLDRAAFTVLAYSLTPITDEVNQRLREMCDQWRDCASKSEEAIVALMRQDKVDIAVDLSGHTANSRPRLFLRRLAPVQVTMIGYPSTTGLPTMDFRVVDSITDPPAGDAARSDGRPPSLTTERLVRVDPCFLCYTPPAGPEVSPPPSDAAGVVTFGSFNASNKINTPLIELWCRVLASVAGSRMVIKARALQTKAFADDIARRFLECGVDASRLDLLAHAPSQADHLALYGRVDVGLDTYPYHGTTTTCEALFMGVPVVTLAGPAEAGHHYSRVGASLLTAIGRAELIGRDRDEYVKIAAGLAADAGRRRELRGTLRRALIGSPLCDGPAYARRVGDAFREMWRSRWRA